MKGIIKNNYKIIIAFLLGIIVSATSVYAIEAYIESNKVTYKNNNKNNVQEAIDELYERSGIHQEKWVDETLNGADPVLKEPLIPVEIKPNGDVYYANQNSEWYNYSEKRWANAVILTSTAKTYTVGEKIAENDIESYFVWIPRYQYKIWDMGEYSFVYEAGSSIKNTDYSSSLIQAVTKPRIIDIRFGTYEKYPKMQESDAAIDTYYTHPAFTLGNKDLNGLWVGKFETGKNESNIIVKPNVSSLLSTNFKSLFDQAYNYRADENNHNNNIDPHMLKNTEWGAIAYLSHSVYGIGTEVKMNNHPYNATGSAIAENTDLDFKGQATADQIKQYNSGAGYLASTTGNISGVYDLAGGAGEGVAACIDGNVGGTGFSTAELKQYMDSGYIDRYSTNSSSRDFTNRKLGDATGELGPFYNYFTSAGLYARSNWYSDFALFVSAEMPCFHRGGGPTQGNIAGAFYFGAYDGSRMGTIRLALAPTI